MFDSLLQSFLWNGPPAAIGTSPHSQGDSTVALVTFKLAPLSYRNSLLSDFSIEGFALKIAEADIDQATTVLIVDVDDNQFPDQIKYEFQPSKILFKTTKPQSLYIPLVCYDQRAGTASPRFHLYNLSTDAKVISAEHLSGIDWLPMSPFSVFPPGAFQARITFDMPQIKGKLYKLNIGVMDTQTGKPKDCDPLIGNDPPTLISGVLHESPNHLAIPLSTT